MADDKMQTAFGLDHKIFHAGDRVKFLGLSGTVEPWVTVDKSWMVPVVFDNSDSLITMTHYEALEKVVDEVSCVATLGDPAFSGVWQPTGEKFEVMFYGDEPAGKFYLRERLT